METLDKDKLPGKNKEQLLADQERLKSEMEYQLDGIKDDAADIGKKVLMVGGGIYLTYKLIRLVTRSKRKKKVKLFQANGRPVVINREEKVAPGIGTLILQQLMTVAVVAIASKLQATIKDR